MNELAETIATLCQNYPIGDILSALLEEHEHGTAMVELTVDGELRIFNGLGNADALRSAVQMYHDTMWAMPIGE